jgi:hypothetical protein
VFVEHFPALRSSVEALENRAVALPAVRERLTKEAHESGMDKEPWRPEDFIPQLVGVIDARAHQGLLGGRFDFNWVQDGALIGLDDPTYGPTIFSLIASPEDIRGYQETFEEFFREAERLPEATGLQEVGSAAYTAKQRLTRELDVIMNKDTFTTRCTLCRQQ